MEFVECGRRSEHRREVDSQFVESAAEVPDVRIASDHDVRRSVGLQSAHWQHPGLEPAVIGLAPLKRVLTEVVERGRDQLVHQDRQDRSTIGDDLRRDAMRTQGRGEEPSC